MEIWDTYYENGSLEGSNIIRGEAIMDGLFHLVCEVIVRHNDGDYLLMQRCWSKNFYPGMYEASASGSALKGESALEGAIRELKEETGMYSSNLKFICKSVNPNTHGIYYVYLCETDCCKDAITLQEGETISYQWMGQEELMKFIETEQYIKADKERKQIYFDSLR